MQKMKTHIRDAAITVSTLALCFGAGIIMQHPLAIQEQITTSFAFAVFLISLCTDGYFWGLTSAMASVLLVNYAFTFPYFKLDFSIPSNAFSALVMAIISVLTSALTTKVKRSEAMKAESEKERMRANLLRAISHDLRTPLTTIYGSSTALRENRDMLTPEQTDSMLRGIQEDSQWLVRMVENLLSITRFDSGNVRIAKVPTALDELIDASIVKFHKHYPDRKVDLTLPEELLIIPMDAILVEQVLLNLLENAVQHGHGLTKLQLRVYAAQGQAVFEVEDDGCGIPPERLPTLFTGYHQSAQQPADTEKRNAGIGLSVCATIIKAHGGSISAENIPSGGALFRFILNAEELQDEQ